MRKDHSMKISKPWIIASTLALTIAFFSTPPAAHADTYKIYDLGSTYSRIPVGIEASGTVVVFDHHEQCGLQAGNCYESWTDGILTGKSTINPDHFDNGTECTPNAPAEFTGAIPYGVCNNGREVYGTDISVPPPYTTSIFTGPDPVADFFAHDWLDEAFLNASGDFAYSANQRGGNLEQMYQVIDLTSDTPEPASLILLCTGLLAGLGTMRTRWLQRRS
jgi:hypothetical protein